ncbi:MAG: hypothetical protein ABI594_03175 [Ginsengibacter sp.]
MKYFFINTYKVIKTKYWGDPVWSKVISAGIISILGSIITALYLLGKAFIDKVSFKDAFNSLLFFLKRTTQINNLAILICVIFILITTVNFITKFVKDIEQKRKANLTESVKEELPLVPFEPSIFFADRLAGAFPGQRGLVWYNDPKVIVERLSILFQKPIKFKIDEREGFSSHPIWWFRELSSMYIENFEKLSKTKVLIGVKELEVKRMAVNIDRAYYKCFIYLEVKGEKQTGLYNIDGSDIKRHIETFGYSWEEFGLYKNIPITREEYDDGAAIIKGKVVETFGAKLRQRFLTDYNFLITGHDSPFNSQKFEKETDKYFDNILSGKVDAERLFEFLDTFQKRER